MKVEIVTSIILLVNISFSRPQDNQQVISGIRQGPDGLGDGKTSLNNPAFAPFDDKPKGSTFITQASTRDDECFTACSNGAICRAPDALQPGVESCRDGLTPNFNGGLSFDTIEPSQGVGPGFSNNNAGNDDNAGGNNDAGNSNDNENDGDGQQQVINGIRQGPDGLGDGKTSLNNPAFAPFDDKPKGSTFITQASTRDDECFTACSNGAICRAPDALTPGETCRDGKTPNFANGLSFDTIEPSQGVGPGL